MARVRGRRRSPIETAPSSAPEAPPHHLRLPHPHIPPPPTLRPRDVWEWYSETVPASLALLVPLVLFAVPLVVLAFVLPEAIPKTWSFMVVLPFALDIGIIVGLSLDLAWWFVLAITLWVEFAVLLFLLRNLHLLRRWGWFDRVMQRQERRAVQAYQRHGWIRKFHFLGVTVFVFLPFSSGILVGVLLGKFTGMSDQRTMGAVYIGTVLWAGFFVWFGDLSLEFIRDVAGRLL